MTLFFSFVNPTFASDLQPTMEHEKLLMLIDDDSCARYFFNYAVSEVSPKWKCIFAEDGIKGLDCLKEMDKLPEFIFLDINMPKMDGWECLKKLKADQILKEIPVIMYSTSQREEDALKALSLGAAYYLQKSMDISTLSSEIITSIRIAEKSI